jgi:FtsH-binding integral membrane protein
MIDIVQFLHSWTRWIVIVVSIVALVYLVLRLNRDWDAMAARLMSAFSSLVGLQWALGLVLLIVRGSQTGFNVRHYWEHLFMMTLALIVAHGHYMWRRRELTSRARYTRNLATIIVALILVVIGIMALPEGIRWRLYGIGA